MTSLACRLLQHKYRSWPPSCPLLVRKSISAKLNIYLQPSPLSRRRLHIEEHHVFSNLHDGHRGHVCDCIIYQPLSRRHQAEVIVVVCSSSEPQKAGSRSMTMRDTMISGVGRRVLSGSNEKREGRGEREAWVFNVEGEMRREDGCYSYRDLS